MRAAAIVASLERVQSAIKLLEHFCAKLPETLVVIDSGNPPLRCASTVLKPLTALGTRARMPASCAHQTPCPPCWKC